MVKRAWLRGNDVLAKSRTVRKTARPHLSIYACNLLYNGRLYYDDGPRLTRYTLRYKQRVIEKSSVKVAWRKISLKLVIKIADAARLKCTPVVTNLVI